MIGYRLYCLRDGQIVSAVAFEAEDDVAAIEASRAQANTIDCELWSDNRLVAFVPATPDGEE